MLDGEPDRQVVAVAAQRIPGSRFVDGVDKDNGVNVSPVTAELCDHGNAASAGDD